MYGQSKKDKNTCGKGRLSCQTSVNALPASEDARTMHTKELPQARTDCCGGAIGNWHTHLHVHTQPRSRPRWGNSFRLGCGVKRQVAVHVTDSSGEDKVRSFKDRQKHKQQGPLELPDPEPHECKCLTCIRGFVDNARKELPQARADCVEIIPVAGQ